MRIVSSAKLKKFADKAGISVSGHDGGAYPTLEQLAVFAQEVQALCAAKCLAVAQKHQQVLSSRASAMKAGALECHEALAPPSPPKARARCA